MAIGMARCLLFPPSLLKRLGLILLLPRPLEDFYAQPQREMYFFSSIGLSPVLPKLTGAFLKGGFDW